MVLWSKNLQLYKGIIIVFKIFFLDSKTFSIELRTRADSLATRRNIVKMLVACVSVYFVCYSPIQGVFLTK